MDSRVCLGDLKGYFWYLEGRRVCDGQYKRMGGMFV
jgi:hypothetical protein